MKYIKLFENQDNIDICKMLLSHLTKVFNQLDYDYYNYLVYGLYETEFQDSNKENLFKFIYDPYTKHFSIRLFDSTDEVLFIPEYFKTITGLKFQDTKYFNRYIYDILDVDKAIEQISKEDFELKFTSNKYNI